MSLCVAESPMLTLVSNRNSMEGIGRHHYDNQRDGRGVGTTVTASCAVYRTHTEADLQGSRHTHTGCAGSTTKSTSNQQQTDTDYCVTPTEIHNSLRNIHKPDNFLDAAYVIFTTLCGASTVAIDNKIEQAMDLVKSHLMFAVREEVEVLKEQIKELLEKNSQLEFENSVLKASATQETLQKLQQNNPQPPPSNS